MYYLGFGYKSDVRLTCPSFSAHRNHIQNKSDDRLTNNLTTD